jgi:hypothetical protein
MAFQMSQATINALAQQVAQAALQAFPQSQATGGNAEGGARSVPAASVTGGGGAMEVGDVNVAAGGGANAPPDAGGAGESQADDELMQVVHRGVELMVPAVMLDCMYNAHHRGAHAR